jgi:hypothetical protein
MAISVWLRLEPMPVRGLLRRREFEVRKGTFASIWWHVAAGVDADRAISRSEAARDDVRADPNVRSLTPTPQICRSANGQLKSKIGRSAARPFTPFPAKMAIP